MDSIKKRVKNTGGTLHASILNRSTSILSNVRQCHAVARQTVELSASSLETGRDLVSCGESIQMALAGAASDLSAESFVVIADLIDGGKAREARQLAVAMKAKSTECVSLSVQMVKSLEHILGALPDIFESYIEKKAQQLITGKLTTEERDLAYGIQGDAEELIRCIDAIENLKLLTAIDAGNRGFEAIKGKSGLCHRIFEMIKKIATDVASITEAISKMDAPAVLSKIKDGSILRAIGLSKYIKQFAEGCKLITDRIIELLKCASRKLATFWRALSKAKDLMVNSLTAVMSTRSLCDEAGQKAERLKEVLSSLCNLEVIKLMTSLSGDKKRSMNDAVGTAQEVDAGMGEAARRMRNATRMVADEYHSLPSMITEGIADNTEDEVARLLGARIGDVEGDIQELEIATQSIKEADVISAAMSIHREISNIPDKVDACRDMIKNCGDFVDRSKLSINSFLGKWSPETAVSHIKEMCRLVSLSKLVEHLADQIHRLVMAIAALLRAASAKVQLVNKQLRGSELGSIADAATDFVSDGMKKLFGR